MIAGNNKIAFIEKFPLKKYRIKISKAIVSIVIIALLSFIATPLFAQNAEDSTDGRFHDDLLNHLVGKWNVTSIIHGSPFTADFEAEWVMNHQYLRIHLKSHEIIPWWHVQMEFEEFVGYNHNTKQYVIHGMSIEGDEDPSEGFLYGYRTGDEFKTVAKFGADSLIVQRYTLQSAYRDVTHSDSWNIKSAWVIGGKEGDTFLEMQLRAAKTSTK